MIQVGIFYFEFVIIKAALLFEGAHCVQFSQSNDEAKLDAEQVTLWKLTRLTGFPVTGNQVSYETKFL